MSWDLESYITLFEIFIFCPKIQLWFPEKIVDFFRWKTRENVVVLDFLAVDNFDFTRKIVKKILGEKLVKMLGWLGLDPELQCFGIQIFIVPDSLSFLKFYCTKTLPQYFSLL